MSAAALGEFLERRKRAPAGGNNRYPLHYSYTVSRLEFSGFLRGTLDSQDHLFPCCRCGNADLVTKFPERVQGKVINAVIELEDCVLWPESSHYSLMCFSARSLAILMMAPKFLIGLASPT